MITEQQVEQLNRSFKRIFALPISRMTLRELQNALSTTLPKPEEHQGLYASLLNGELQDHFKKNGDISELMDLINTYSTPTRMAREVAEMGEFMNSFSCDFLQQGNNVFFVNRMRRIDGQEYQFLSAPEINIRLGRMFINRLRDLKKAVGAKALQMDPSVTEELKQLKKDIDDLLA